MNKKWTAALNSYARALFVAVFTVYTTNPDGKPSDILKAGIIAFLAPIIRALNPDDTQFGIGSKNDTN